MKSKATKTTRKELSEGTELFREGNEGGFGFYIESGCVDIWIEREGEHVALATLTKGDFVGELSTFDLAPRSASATTASDCVLLEFSHDQISKRIQAMDPVMRNLIGSLARRIRLTNSQITKSFGSSMERAFDIPMNLVDENCLEDLTLEVELQQAIENEEFELYFQPIIDLKTMKLAGLEALIRWMHPEKGMISPDNFIPFAEERGLISGITKWCVSKTCELAPEFQLSALLNPKNVDSLFLAVNISGKNISCEKFAGWIEEKIRTSKCSPEMLKLEVTESSLLENMDVAKNTLNRLRDIGVGIAIDDFGTGQSNLAYLNQLPMTTLKIDRSFVTGKLNEQSNQQVVKLIMGLARELEAGVVAEGIETIEDLDILVQMNCDYGQGYYFAKPMPFLNALDFIRDWHEAPEQVALNISTAV